MLFVKSRAGTWQFLAERMKYLEIPMLPGVPGRESWKWGQTHSTNHKYCRLHQSGKYIEMNALYFYKRELFLERKVQLLNTVHVLINAIQHFSRCTVSLSTRA
jgi:hypothetical protein